MPLWYATLRYRCLKCWLCMKTREIYDKISYLVKRALDDFRIYLCSRFFKSRTFEERQSYIRMLKLSNSRYNFISLTFVDDDQYKV